MLQIVSFSVSRIQSEPGIKTHPVMPALHTLEAEAERKIRDPLLVDIISLQSRGVFE